MLRFENDYSEGAHEKVLQRLIDTNMEISKNAIETAEILKQAFREKGYRFFVETPTNQIFIVLEDEKLKQLQEQVVVSFWEKADDTHTVVRFATSWATTEKDVQALIELL